MTAAARPLQGLKVIEFTHMVMGPAAGAMLAELGAEVIRVEPPGGDSTRNLKGSGAGYFPMYNRGKKSVCLNLKHPSGLDAARRLIATQDVLLENFRPGTMDRLGLDYDTVSHDNPGLIYASEKGFLQGPYAHRAALDEVAQMMSGLAYMTGPPGRPLRAGASVIDVTGGMFAVIAILAALHERQRTGRGQQLTSALYETSVYLVGQHMAQKAVTGAAAAPMPARVSAWAIYDVFKTKDDQQVFIGIVSDSLWEKFCDVFAVPELAADPRYRTNNQRVQARAELLPLVTAIAGAHTQSELLAKLEHAGLPFAPIGKPEDLFDDEHLSASGGLAPVILPNGSQTRLPILPVEMNGQRTATNGQLAYPGQHTREVMAAVGISPQQIAKLLADGAIADSNDVHAAGASS